MISINILDIIKSQNAVTHNFGIQVYEVISPLLSNNTPVCLSFDGLKNITSGFANASIGKLYMDFSKAGELLKLEGVEKNVIWQEKVNNAIYLATNQEDIKLQNEAISELLSS